MSNYVPFRELDSIRTSLLERYRCINLWVKCLALYHCTADHSLISLGWLPLVDYPLCYTNSVRPSYTIADCGHAIRPIETILLSLESPNILILFDHS